MSLFNRKQNDEIKEEAAVKEQKAIETLGSKIARLRKENGYTQEEFSQLLDVTAQAVSKWENDLSCPDIMLLPKISQLLGISIDEMLGNAAHKAETAEEAKPQVDINKLSIKIHVTGEGRKPVNVAFPMAMIKKFTKLGTGISNIINVNSPSVDKKKIEQIFELVDEGVTGEVLNVTDENGQNVIIEIS